MKTIRIIDKVYDELGVKAMQEIQKIKREKLNEWACEDSKKSQERYMQSGKRIDKANQMLKQIEHTVNVLVPRVIKFKSYEDIGFAVEIHAENLTENEVVEYMRKLEYSIDMVNEICILEINNSGKYDIIAN